jgi:hypothetical protein
VPTIAQGNGRDAIQVGTAAGAPAMVPQTQLGAGMPLSVSLESPNSSLVGQPFITVLDLMPLFGATPLALPGEPGAIVVTANFYTLVNSFDGSGIIPFAGGLPANGFQVGFSLPYVRTTGDLVFQSVVLDPTAPNGLAVTNASGGRFGTPPTVYPIFVSNSVLAQFGYGTSAFDINGDGADELLLGSIEHSLPGLPDIGAVHIYAGIPPTLQQVLTDPNPESLAQFGTSISAADINGDSHVDLVVGARAHDSFGINDAGRVVVFFGPSYLTHQVLLPPTPIARGQFGHWTACGDFNADGYPDVAVSSIGQASAGIIQSGDLDVFYGPSLTTSFNVQNPVPGVGDRFGYRMEAKDFDGDGFCDLAVAAPFKPLIPGGTDSSGALHVLRGPLFLPHAYFPNPTPTTTGLLGADMVWKDMDNDGSLDLVSGAELDSYGATSQAGSVYIVYGPSYTSHVKVLPPIPTAGAGFGAGSDAGDFNGDGIIDLMVGEFYWSPPFRAGQAHVLLGPTYTTAVSVLEAGAGSNNQFGRRIRAADMDGDGKAEMIVGTPLSTASGVTRAGAVYVVRH